MQIRCQNCHKPFGLGKDAVHAALDQMQQEELSHYDVRCPHCGKGNHVSKNELLRAAPDWKGTVETKS
jgi:Zn finger protein HypA/HybF involved in hydrogenase expression